MPVLSQAAEPLDLQWTQGDPIDLQSILVGKAAWAGAATIESDNTTLALMTVTLVADNADVLAHFQLSGVNSLLIPIGTYPYKIRKTGGSILAAGNAYVLTGTTSTWIAPPNMALITPDDVFDWMSTPGIRNHDSMQRVVNAVIARISRGWTPPAVQPNDDWILAHIMQAARIWKRKASPEGVIDSGEFGPIRVTRIDADIADLLSDFSRGPWPA